MEKTTRYNKNHIYSLLILLVLSFLLRFVGLGYSHFYGDETKTFYLDKTVTAINFFLDQRKGPVQFLVVWVTEKLFGGFDEALTRIPFAIAGLASVFLFYLIAKKLFDHKTAWVAAFLFSINGFYIAFSRTVQYQSFLLLFGLLAIYLFLYYLDNPKNPAHKTILFFSSISLSLAFLCHYDAIFFLIPIILLALQKRVISISFVLLFIAPLVTVVVFFYLPYITQGYFTENTLGYLDKRFLGKEYSPNNSLYTAKVYNPMYLAFIPLFFAFFGFLKGYNWKNLMLLAWFVVPYAVFEFVILNPGTHIHNYYLPLILLASSGLLNVFDWLKSQKPLLAYWFLVSIVGLVFIFSLMVSLYVYIPTLHSGYPWKSGTIAFLQLKSPEKSYHLYLYGFPYYRGWDQIRDYLGSQEGVRGFYTNDNPTVAKYYLYKYDLTPPGSNFLPQYYVYVYEGQEFKYPEQVFLDSYLREKDFYNGGDLVSTIYKKRAESY